jgi:hypothetical protein
MDEKYPGMSPYNYVGNNPINNIDLRGDSITPVGANQHLQMGIINWDKGVSAGNGYTLYGGTGTNSSGGATQMWVARQDVGDGMHRDDYVMDVTDVKEFRDNSFKYKTLSNIVNTFENGGLGLWDGYKSTWTLENILIGATIIGGALKSPKGPVTNELYVRPNNATTKAQRASVQGKPCVDCDANVARNNADHIYPLVREHYETGSINTTRMRRIDAVQPQCPTCSS